MLVGTTLVATTASAQPEEPKTSSLSWIRLEGAEGCVGTRELAQEVEALLRRPVFVSASQADLSVEGNVSPSAGGGFQASITVSGAGGEPLGTRDLATGEADCRALDDSLSLAIALMIDPDADLSKGAAPPAPADPEPPPAPPPEVIVKKEKVYVPVPVDRPVPAPAEPEPEPWRWDVRAGPLLGFGVLPSPAAGVHASVTAEPPWFIAAEGSFAAFVPQSEGGASGTSVEFTMLYVGGALCPIALREGRLSVHLCGEQHLGLVRAKGTGFLQDRDSANVIWNFAARARVALRVMGPVTVGVGLMGAVPVIRDRFVTSGAQSAEVFQMSQVVALPDLTVGLQFPE